ncbi:M56 family metallopeptidase [Pedobacter polysacchareus]|uniref:M56 family metallopeptidase n=1 Tax=Pedobacter polysacchareus TaxID=2861973 RepID=UPI001C98F313|nr:M56 family metallopeptidase [Pedobacter polysacchareus]
MMEQLALYLLKSTVCISGFLGVYWCFLKNETFYRFNRYFLLAGLLTAALLPFYTYTFKVNSVPNVAVLPASSPSAIVQTTAGSPLIYLFLIVVYALGIVFFGLRYFIGLSKLKSLIRKYGFTEMKGYRLVKTNDLKSSFSVFNYILVNGSAETSEIEKKLIFEHELAHVKQFHWLDLLLSQLLCVFQWFNPLVWVYTFCIKQNHEFLADTAVLAKGNPVGLYRAALLNHSLGTPIFALSSYFAHYDKLKRVKMMTKAASASTKKLIVLVLLPLLAVFLWAFAKPIFVTVPDVRARGLATSRGIVSNAASSEVTAPGYARQEVLADTAQVKPQKKASTVIKVESKEVEMKPKEPAPVILEATLLPTVSDDMVVSPVKTTAIKPSVLVYLDGQEIHYEINQIKSETIESIHVLKGTSATDLYGERGKDGVVIITSKKQL